MTIQPIDLPVTFQFPSTAQTAMTEAELACFNSLNQIHGSIPGKSSYIGADPVVVNTWWFRLQTPADHETIFPPFWSQSPQDMKVLAWEGQVVVNNVKRDKVQEFLMLTMTNMPICYEKNLIEFKINTVGEIELVEIPLSNTEKTRSTWQLIIDFDIIFAIKPKD